MSWIVISNKIMKPSMELKCDNIKQHTIRWLTKVYD